MEPHWLVRPRNVRLLWRAFLVVLALTVVAEFFVERRPRTTGSSRLFGFGAWFGFVACAVLIVVGQGARRVAQAARHLLRLRTAR